jgi:hypothetical protein
MPDQPNQPGQKLSEISHLFLSGIRQKQAGGATPRAARTPPQPGRQSDSVDLTPEEFAEVFGDQAKTVQEENDDPDPAIGPVRAVLASHLGPQQLARVQEYAAHICPPGQRIGLIAVDTSEFRLSIFEHNPHPNQNPAIAQQSDSDMLDARKMTQALDELAWDVDQWLLLLPTTRAPEARALLRDVVNWTLLATCDHDGVVACYRTLKGLSDLHRPRLSLATLDPASDGEAVSAYQRLASVCRQFLDWSLIDESPVAPSSGVTEHVILWSCATRDKAQLANPPQWQVVTDFLARASKTQIANEPAAPISTAAPKTSEPVRISQNSSDAKISAEPVAMPAQPTATIADTPEVIELPDGPISAAAIVSAVLRGGHELVECPVKPPMCPEASLAVSRDRRLVLLAVARQGLNDLRQIGRAYQWLIENRPLIGMAVPQMSIDAHQLPCLHLLVDHADMSAEVLQPILQSTSVTVHAYRKLRWGGKIPKDLHLELSPGIGDACRKTLW